LTYLVRQLRHLEIGLVGTRKGSKILHDLLDAFRSFATPREQFRNRITVFRRVATRLLGRNELPDELVEELQVRMHEADRIVQLVGDTRDQLAEALQLLALHQLVLGFLQFACSRFHSRFEALVQLRDLVERLGIFDRDRTLVGECPEELTIVRRKPLP